MDFEEQHRKKWEGMVFAPYSGDMIAGAARDDALAVLEDAAGRCLDEDTRSQEVTAALAYLKARATRGGFFDQFASALDIHSPDARWQNVNAAMNGICRVLGVSRPGRGL